MGRKFRALLKDEDYLFTGGVYSPLDAQIAQSAGMKSIYLSGYSMALANGWPDFIPGSEDRIKGSHGFDDKRAH
jgi:2-methylisocitrate lyase-like PEP mutase family enzyme